ncbi:MAG TPA: hypothetical protein VIV60_28145 [Polyangiaceae bacterium]
MKNLSTGLGIAVGFKPVSSLDDSWLDVVFEPISVLDGNWLEAGLTLAATFNDD